MVNNESIWVNRGVTFTPPKDKVGWWESYDNTAIPRRKFFVESIFKHSPGSVLELGCCGGCNIQHFPAEKLQNTIGIDINSGAIKYAKNKNLAATFINGDITMPFDFLSSNVDIVCSMGVLIHMPKNKIDNVLKNMLDVCNIGLVLIETAGKEQTLNPDPFKEQYIYDIPRRIKSINSNVDISVNDLIEQHNDFGASASRLRLIEIIKK